MLQSENEAKQRDILELRREFDAVTTRLYREREEMAAAYEKRLREIDIKAAVDGAEYKSRIEALEKQLVDTRVFHEGEKNSLRAALLQAEDRLRRREERLKEFKRLRLEFVDHASRKDHELLDLSLTVVEEAKAVARDLSSRNITLLPSVSLDTSINMASHIVQASTPKRK